jgi:hypothetical protein
MNDGTAPKGGPGHLRRLEPNKRRRRRPRPQSPKCHDAQLTLDDELAAKVEGFADWDVFAERRPS